MNEPSQFLESRKTGTDSTHKTTMNDAHNAAANARASQAEAALADEKARTDAARQECASLRGELAKRIEDYLSGYACCSGSECNCHGITKLQQYVYDTCSEQVDKINASKGDLKAQLAAMREDKDRMEAALQKIADWSDFPPAEFRGKPCSYSFAYGSNGERDHMRSIARAALDAARARTDGKGL